MFNVCRLDLCSCFGLLPLGVSTGNFYRSLPYILIGSLSVLSGLLSLLLPESLGMPLPESINHMQTIPWWEPKHQAYTNTSCSNIDLIMGINRFCFSWLWVNELIVHVCFSAIRKARNLKTTIWPVLKEMRTIQMKLCDWCTHLNLILLE